MRSALPIVSTDSSGGGGFHTHQESLRHRHMPDAMAKGKRVRSFPRGARTRSLGRERRVPSATTV